MIERLQAILAEERPSKAVVYNFHYGYQYFERLNLLVRVPYPANHFLTLVEPACNFVTAMKYDHTRIGQTVPIKDIQDTDPIYWIETVHGNNVDNDIRMSLRIRPRTAPADLSRYGISRRITRKESMVGAFIYLPVQVLRKIIRRLTGKIKQRIRK